MQKNESPIRECCQVSRRWCLEGFFVASGQQVRIVVASLPLRIGRSESAQFTINHPSISRMHAELVEQDGCLAIADSNSRNGTFVNYQKIETRTSLVAGDCVHLGSCEFRVVAENETLDEKRDADQTWVIKEPGGAEFQRLMNDEAVFAQFQPVIMLEGSTVFAFESLGRGNFPGAPSKPDDLFRMAKRYGYSQDLSNIFRVNALRMAEKLPRNYQIFFNVHADELRKPQQFIDEMVQVHDLYPNMNLIAEIPESLALDIEAMLDIKAALRDLGYGIAYDDFGVGQSRLVQLADCPPDYLKFDRSLICDLDSAPAERQKMVKLLADFAADIGVITIAEGVETAAESETCRQMGFRCGQGYLYGRPLPAEEAFMM